MTSLPDHIKQLRSAGVSVVAIARLAQCHPATVARIEGGTDPLHSVALRILAIRPPVAMAKKMGAVAGAQREEREIKAKDIT